jgi:hypothetical protein
VIAVVVVLAAPAGAFVRRMRHAATWWRATEAELRAVWPADGLVDRPKFT